MKDYKMVAAPWLPVSSQAVDILRHSSAQFLQASTQFLHIAMSMCLLHSAAQALHICSQSEHANFANSLFRDISRPVTMHISAQSMQSWTQRDIDFMPGVLIHSIIHMSHASTQSKHESIHFWFISCFIICIDNHLIFYCFIYTLNNPE
jgi:hypothetical protein